MTTATLKRWGRWKRPRPLTVVFNAAKIAGRGEDADPLLRINDAAMTLAVFDGLGGSGALRCTGSDGIQTGAYYGARTARDSTEAFLKLAEQFAHVTPDALAAVLAQHLSHDLRAYAETCGRTTGSALRSTLFRRLPTTAAIAVARPTAIAVRTTLLWAGDSRCYALSPTSGLQQLTRDHLATPSDALANLTTDSSISNCISADGPFVIETAECLIQTPTIILAATDGCFGYVPTPMHFEALVLSTLVAARSCDDWRDRLRRAITTVAGDDASLSAVAIGWPSYSALRRTFVERLQFLRSTYLTPISADATQRDAVWRTYRRTYEALQPMERTHD